MTCPICGCLIEAGELVVKLYRGRKLPGGPKPSDEPWTGVDFAHISCLGSVKE